MIRRLEVHDLRVQLDQEAGGIASRAISLR
jgi:hypothetical protein